MRAERAERERAERDRAEERAKGVLEHALRESGRVRLLVQGQPQLEVGEPPLKRQKLDFEQLLAEHSVVSFWREFCSQATGLQYFNVPEWLYPDALSPSVFIRECCWGPTGATNVKSRAQTQVMYSVLGDDVLAEVFVWHAATLLRIYFSPPHALSQHTRLRLVRGMCIVATWETACANCWFTRAARFAGAGAQCLTHLQRSRGHH
eukprot:TRINITY_DN2153_c0_g1_i9.p1 TRINITY_DN2153_c0_g1~~TRINITY_DN2153_c0_g1_i9.p1  ORF type:complete len:206 (-),score=32.05 TRINITY_DN2153_c0_g1_i9:1037-1654(-)